MILSLSFSYQIGLIINSYKNILDVINVSIGYYWKLVNLFIFFNLKRKKIHNNIAHIVDYYNYNYYCNNKLN